MDTFKTIESYKDSYSVSQVMTETGYSRNKIVDLLKTEGIYEGLKGPNYSIKMRERMQNQSQPINKGQRALIESNTISYDRIPFDNELLSYKKKVEKLSRKNALELKSTTHCEYTGIPFADNFKEKVNPNDPRKRSIDHKTSVIHCFLEGKSVEECSQVSNLAYVLRYVNSIKGNMNLKDFEPLRKVLKEKLNEDL